MKYKRHIFKLVISETPGSRGLADEIVKRKLLDTFFEVFEKGEVDMEAYYVGDEEAQLLVRAKGIRKLKQETKKAVEAFQKEIWEGLRPGEQKLKIEYFNLGIYREEELLAARQMIHSLPVIRGEAKSAKDYWWSSAGNRNPKRRKQRFIIRNV